METLRKYNSKEYSLEVFSREKALSRKPVCTREFMGVEMSDFESNDPEYPLSGRIVSDYEELLRWRIDGRYDKDVENHYLDLFHPVKIIDTSKGLDINSGGALVSVEGSCDDVNETEKGRDFCEYIHPNGKVYKFPKPGPEPFEPNFEMPKHELQFIMPLHRGFYVGSSEEEIEKATKYRDKMTEIMYSSPKPAKRSLLSITLEEAIDVIKISYALYPNVTDWTKDKEAIFFLEQVEYQGDLKYIYLKFKTNPTQGQPTELIFKNESPFIEFPDHDQGDAHFWYLAFKYLESRGFDLDSTFGLS